MADKKKDSKVEVIKAGAYTKKMRKLDSMGLSFNSKEVEDEFAQFQGVHDLIAAPFNPRWLKLLVTHNNTLNQAISAMEINIDGSGFVIEAKENKENVPDADIEKVEQYFEEIAPGVSFLELRRKTRRDIESCGYAFLEVIRNMAGEALAIKRVDPSTIRLMKLGPPVLVEKTLMRGGQELKVKVWVRERRYLQWVGNCKTFFSEFQASRKINKNNGTWVEQGQKIDIKDQGTELIYLTLELEANGPYGIPRWINNLPSVLGSRKAEEQNLDFFDNGGVPPVIMTIMGGKMAGDVKKQLSNFLSGRTPNTRVAILEAQADDGAIDGTNSKLKIDVQRFGSEKIQDSMFENYDERCSERIRSSFRLPPLFIGKVRDFNFATAIAAYQIAESQVFQPERMEFDNTMTRFINTELGFTDIRFRSLPIVLSDAKVQFTALQFAFNKGTIDTEQFLNALNSITALGLTFDESLEVDPIDDTPPAAGDNPDDNPDDNSDDDNDDDQDDDAQKKDKAKPYPDDKPNDKEKKYTIHKDAKDITDLITMANEIVNVVGGLGDDLSIEDEGVLEKYNKMEEENKVFVRDLISMKVLDNIEIDRTGANELLDGCLHTLEEAESEHGED